MNASAQAKSLKMKAMKIFLPANAKFWRQKTANLLKRGNNLEPKNPNPLKRGNNLT